MLRREFQQVRMLTEQIAEFVEAFNIEGCKLLIEQRLVLLNQIRDELLNCSDDLVQQEFRDLLIWLEKYDQSPYAKACELKDRYREKLSKQKKTNFAIKQYTKF